MSQVRRIFGIIVVSLIAVVNANATIEPIAPSVDGNGCYLIGTSAELYGFSAITNGTMTAVAGAASPYCVKLTDDITVNAGVLNETATAVNAVDSATFEKWTPIKNFTGTFDGDEHEISGLYVNFPASSSSSNNRKGFFDSTFVNTTVKNLGIVDSYIQGGNNVGVFAGGANGTTFLNCYSRSYVKGYRYVGSLAGFSNGTVNVVNSYAVGYVNATNGTGYYGMLLGKNPTTKIVKNSYSLNLYTTAGTVENGTKKTAEEFANGTVLNNLFSAAYGGIWRQGDDDAYPDFKGDEVKGTNLCYLHFSDDWIEGIDCASQKFLPKEIQGDKIINGWYTSASFSGDAVLKMPENTSAGTTLYAKWSLFTQPLVVDGCYQLGSAADLYSFAKIVNGSLTGADGAASPYCAKLTADIVVNGDVLDAAGTAVNAIDSLRFLDWTPIQNFSGTFDGDGHEISGLYVNFPVTSSPTNNKKGLFDSTLVNTTIKNLGIVDSYFQGYNSVGAFVGGANGTTFLNCYSRSYVKGYRYEGSLAGFSNGTMNVVNSYAVGYVNATNGTGYYGMLLGRNSTTINVTNSYSLNLYTTAGTASNGTSKTAEEFANGNVVSALFSDAEGRIWRQGENDAYPNFKGDNIKSVDICKLIYSNEHEEIVNCAYKPLPRAINETQMISSWAFASNPSDTITEMPENAAPGTTLIAKWADFVQPQIVDGCYQIGTAVDLYSFAKIVNGTLSTGRAAEPSACAKLTADIVVNANVLNASGSDVNYLDSARFVGWTPMTSYTGTFDGNGHVISGLYISAPSANNKGLFGTVAGSATIKNLGMEDSYFYGNSYVGAFVGNANSATKLTLLNCYSNSPVKGLSNIGGFAGSVSSGKIYVSNSYVTGNTVRVSGSNSYYGVFFGTAPGASDYKNVYYLSTLTASRKIGSSMTAAQFSDGSVVKNLFEGVNGGIWRQGTNDAYPNFKGNEVKGLDVCYLHHSDDNVEWVNCELAIPRQTRDGYLFEGWFTSADLSGEPVYAFPENASAGTTLYAKWTPLAQPQVVDGCYQISSAADLYSFSAITNGTMTGAANASSPYCVVLTDDIIVNKNVLNADGLGASADTSHFNVWTPIKNFSGTFDGDGHEISGLYVNFPASSSSSNNRKGFFDSTFVNTTVKNLGIVDSYIQGGNNVGVFAGGANGTTFLNCYSRSYVKGYRYVGSLAGFSNGTMNVVNSYAVGYVNATNGTGYYGMLLGRNSTTINVTNSYSLNLYATAGTASNGTFKTAEEFANGNVVSALFSDAEGRIWRQGENDAYPNFKGDAIKGVDVCYLHYVDGVDEWVPCGSKLPAPTREGYLFRGWFPAADYSGEMLSAVPETVGSTSYAKWEKFAKPQVVDGCYHLGSAVDLYSFAKIVNGEMDGAAGAASPYCVKLTDDIVINRNVLDSASKVVNSADSSNFIDWTPIKNFTGTFDGNGHVISGLFVNERTFDPAYSYKGLFATVSGVVTIKNLGIEDSYFYGYDYIGAFVGYVKSGATLSIQNCFGKNYVGRGNRYAGGFVGYREGVVNIDNCYVKGEVVNGNYAGVFVSTNLTSNIQNSYYLDGMSGTYQGTKKTAEQFSNGDLAFSLYTGENGQIWRQGLNDATPNFKGDDVKGVCNLHYYDGMDRAYNCSAMNLPKPARGGYSFEGWYADENLTGDAVAKLSAIPVDKPTFYAKWRLLNKPQVVDGCYQIASADDLYGFSGIASGDVEGVDGAATPYCVKLVNDIVVNQNVLNADGNDVNAADSSTFRVWAPIKNFTGTFDGQGHVISGLYFHGEENNEANKNVALFANVSETAEIKNLGMEDSYFYGYENVASFVGATDANANLTFLNVYSRIYLRAVYNCVAGFVGNASLSTINLFNSYSAAEVFHGTGYSNSYDMFFCRYNKVNVRNSFLLYVNTSSSWGKISELKDFSSGAIVDSLFSAVDGHIWRQGKEDTFPSFRGDVVKGVDICYLHYSDDLIEMVNCAAALPMKSTETSMLAGWYTTPDFSGVAITGKPENLAAGTTLYPKWSTFAVPSMKDGCYQLGSAIELYSFAKIVNGTYAVVRDAEPDACAELTADITVNSGVLSDGMNSLNNGDYIPWTPINNFAGSIDGKGHVISGLYVDDATADNVGFISSVSGTVEIKNLGIEDSYFHGYNNVGAFIGDALNVTKLSFLNSYSRSYVLANNYYAGGFAGRTNGSGTYLDNCYAVGYADARGYSYYDGAFFGVSINSSNILNSYYVSGTGYVKNGTNVYASQFMSGEVAVKLHNGENGGIWHQEESDTYPSFKGEHLKGACYLHNADNPVETFACVALSDTYKIPQPTRTGHLFEGWFATDDFSGEPVIADNSLRGDLYAKWTKLVAPQKKNECYQIGTMLELYGFAAIVNGTFEEGRDAENETCGELTSDITINSNLLDENDNLANTKFHVSWTPIGIDVYTKFSGKFKGNGHTISGIFFNNIFSQDVGLFGAVENVVEIENLGIEDSYIYAQEYVGALVGYLDVGHVYIKNCYSRGSFRVNTSSYSAGFVGNARQGFVDIENSYVAAIVSSTNGGTFLTSNKYSPTVTHSYYLGSMNTGYKQGTSRSATEFENGSVVADLFDGTEETDGTIWRQGENDEYPSFRGDEVKGVNVCKLHYYGDSTGLVKCGERTLPRVTRTGYRFEGWYRNSEYSEGPFAKMSSEDATGTNYYAKWVAFEEPEVVDGCYQISSAADLYAFAAIVNGTFTENRDAESAACAKLTQNIALNNQIQWTPIGKESVYSFSGNFDGDYHTISGMYFDDEKADYAGLFGFVAGDKATRIANVGIADAYLRGRYVGGLVAYANNAKLSVENVYARGNFVGANSVGGIVGYTSWNGNVSVVNSYAWATIDCQNSHGGIFGTAQQSAKSENSFYLADMMGYSEYEYGKAVSNDLFADGTVATLLHNGENGSQWGQNTDVMTGSAYPDFSGNVISDLEPLTVTLHYGENDERTFEYFDDFRELHTPSRNGRTFFGWYLEADFSDERITSIPSDATSETVIYAKWIGAIDGCVQIASVKDLYDFATLVNGAEGLAPNPYACGKLVDNIIVNSNVLNASGDGVNAADSANFKKWIPIGTYDAPFKGSFDGQGYTISGLYFNDMEKSNVGLIGYIDVANGDTVKIVNLGVENSYLRAGGYIGGIIGGAGHSESDDAGVVVLSKVHSSGVFGEYGDYYSNYVGGIIGYVSTATVNLSNTFSIANVMGDDYIGGLIGDAEYRASIDILNSFTRGKITAGYGVGGFIGRISDVKKLSVANSYSASEIQTSNCSFGSLVGQLYYGDPLDIPNFFYVANERDGKCGPVLGDAVPVETFNDGVIAGLLHSYTVNGNNIGAVWGQKNEDGSYPELNVALEKIAVSRTVALHSFGEETPYTFYESFSKKLPTYSQDGYLFLGWFADEDYSGERLEELPDGATDLYAKWIKITKPQLVNGCYEIATAGELYGFAAIVNGDAVLSGDVVEKDSPNGNICGKLTNNISINKNVLNADGTLSNNSASFIQWIPVGSESYPFAGSFDGDGHTISGLYFNNTSRNEAGLFGTVQGTVSIQNVGMKDYYVRGYNVGGFVGKVDYNTVLTIQNCFAAGYVSGNDDVGGFVGSLYSSFKLQNSFVYGTVDGSYIGVYVGYKYGQGSFSSQNSFYSSNVGDRYGSGSNEASVEQFANGTVLEALQKYNADGIDGSIWYQNVGVDKYPKFAEFKTIVLHYGDEEKPYKFEVSETAFPDLSSDGYIVAGWFLNADFSGEMLAAIPENATDIYANAFKVTKPAQDAGNCYAIGTASELYGFAAIVNGSSYYDGDELVTNAAVANVCGKLTADITVNENVLNADGSLSENASGFAKWTPIGLYDYEKQINALFAGSFDGQGHVVSGLYINDVSMVYGGLFGLAVGNPVVMIQNLGIEDSYMHVGAIVGGVTGGTSYGALNIENVYSKGVFVAESLDGGGKTVGFAGGIVGTTFGGAINISNSYSVATVSCPLNAGMIVGGGMASELVNLISVNNAYYNGTANGETIGNYGESKTLEEFADGTVATLLHHTCADGEENCVDGSIWEQGDTYPILHSIASRVIVLDWNSASDVVVLVDTNFADVAEVRIADGKQFYANGKVYEGELTSEQIAEIGSSTLYPISGVELETDAEGKLVASLNADSEKSLVIATDITVDKVVYKREMKAGIYQTVMLPFNVANLKLDAYSNYGFYRFTSMDENVDGYRYMAMVYRVRLLQANMPYIMKNIGDTDSDGIVFKGEDRITLNTVSSGSREFSATSDDSITWSMKGVYENKVWKTGDSEIGSAYLFAGQEKDGYKIGEFAKLGAGASLRPMRMYLLKDALAQLSRPGMFGSVNHYGSSESIGVRFVDDEEFDEGEETMVEKRITVIPTVIKSNRWYDMKGRALDSKPTAKGNYYYNGKRITIK